MTHYPLFEAGWERGDSKPKCPKCGGEIETVDYHFVGCKTCKLFWALG